MFKVASADPDLTPCSIDCYAYPTPLIRFPLGRRLSGIRELAKGLRTYIDSHHGNATQIVIVGHSLGGVVVRQFTVDELKAGRGKFIKGIVLIASPITGVTLADLGRHLSWKHRHLTQIGKESDLLEAVREDWQFLNVEAKIPTIYIAGGRDSIVPPPKACLRLSAENVYLLPSENHTSLIRPIDGDDTTFKLLKQFVTRTLALSPAVPDEAPPAQRGDVLFDLYSPAAEPYYLRRKIDEDLATASTGAHVWAIGASGMGKTAALRRLAHVEHWRLYHIMLGSHRGLDATALLREMCIELHERAELEFDFARSAELSGLIGQFRRVLRHVSASDPTAILVEELPLSPGEAFSDFVSGISHLVAAAETGEMPTRVVWLFSSITRPVLDQRPEHLRFRERVQLLTLDEWTRADLQRLIDLIRTELQHDLTADDCNLILDRARGNPRFVKILFRRRRYAVGARATINELLDSVESDLFGNE